MGSKLVLVEGDARGTVQKGFHQQLLGIPRRMRIDVLVDGLVRNPPAGVFRVAPSATSRQSALVTKRDG